MRREFELKAAVEGEVDALRERLAESGWRLAFEGRMSDRRYDTPERRLERRDEVLRLRRLASSEGGTRTVLGWKGPAAEEGGYKVRPELEAEVDDERTAEEILRRLGYTEVTLAIDRRICLYEKGDVCARVEMYPVMDTLVELEGDPAEVEGRLDDLGLPRSAWKPWPLQEFIRRFELRTGVQARICGEFDG